MLSSCGHAPGASDMQRRECGLSKACKCPGPTCLLPTAAPSAGLHPVPAWELAGPSPGLCLPVELSPSFLLTYFSSLMRFNDCTAISVFNKPHACVIAIIILIT